MRSLWARIAPLALILSGCSFGAGVDPGTSTTTVTTAPETTTTITTGTTLAPADRAAVEAAASGYLTAWSEFDWESAAGYLADVPLGFALAHEAWRTDLGVTDVTFGILGVEMDGENRRVPFRARIEIRGAGEWEYDGSLPLIWVGSAWKVNWSAAVIHPTLEDDDELRLVVEWGPRGEILTVNGSPLASQIEVKVIGIVPNRIADLEDLLESLETLAGIAPERVVEELERPGIQQDWFLPVGSIPTADYGSVGPQIEAVAGVLVRDGTERAGPERPFADHILGATGPITAEMLDAFGPPYTATATVGRSGLEYALERRLAGIPHQSIERVNRYGRMVEVLHEFPGVDPETITTTLDIEVQRAVEAALDGIEEPAAVVVVDVASGGIRAAASRPLDGFDRALNGRYPPGSTFKVITAAALLGSGTGADEVVACPSAVLVAGRQFTNAGDFDLGRVTLRDAFARSCNTTFAALAAETLLTGELSDAADLFGFDAPYDLPLPSSGGSFPTPADLADRAAAAIGQGRVLVSPLHQATVAAAVAGVGWRSPILLVSDDAPGAPAMDTQVAATLADFMLAVVTAGTGTAAAVPGEEVHGKTGSAEFGTGDEPATHAWFIGYWGDLAFAVVVEGGGYGGSVAAPIAHDIIAALTNQEVP